jgi:hypothetical protein
MTNEVRPLKVVAAALMLACGITILTVAMNGNEAKDRDFIAYWAAGQQLVHHQNPYDGIGIHRLQHAAGYKWDRPFFIRNAPTALFLTAPLGLVSARLGAILWALALVAALVGSIRMIWIMAGRQPDRLHLLGYIFPPCVSLPRSGADWHLSPAGGHHFSLLLRIHALARRRGTSDMCTEAPSFYALWMRNPAVDYRA